MILDALWSWVTSAVSFLFGLFPSFTVPSAFATFSWGDIFSFAGYSNRWINWGLLGICVGLWASVFVGFAAVKVVLFVASKIPGLSISDDL